jgi:hypothetical protein
MLPWAHAALGYLLYSAYSRRQLRRPPIGWPVFAVGFGTQFPDLVDKPLTWTIPLLPYGRSMSHSIFAFGAVMGGLYLLSRYPDHRTLTTAFGVGFLSHLFGDAAGPAIHGDAGGLGFLLWPVTDVPEGDTGSFVEFLLALEPTPMMLFGFVLTAVGLGVWIRDGMPGVTDLFLESRRTPTRE